MRRKKHHHHTRERTAAHELGELCRDAYDEQHSHCPKTALAFAALGKVVPKLAHATPGWSGSALTRSMFRHGKKVH
jgi:hypothetical protein